MKDLTLAQLTTLLVILRDKRWDYGWGEERLVNISEEDKKDFMEVYKVIHDEYTKRMDKEDWRGKSPHLKKMRVP